MAIAGCFTGFHAIPRDFTGFHAFTFAPYHENIGFKNRNSTYIILVFIPSILIEVLSWISFWLDVNLAGPRFALGLTSLLTLATQFSIAQKDLPAVATIKALDIWMFTCICMVFASLIYPILFTGWKYLKLLLHRQEEHKSQLNDIDPVKNLRNSGMPDNGESEKGCRIKRIKPFKKTTIQITKPINLNWLITPHLISELSLKEMEFIADFSIRISWIDEQFLLSEPNFVQLPSHLAQKLWCPWMRFSNCKNCNNLIIDPITILLIDSSAISMCSLVSVNSIQQLHETER
uniref:Neurotransmitter-gated ion-channel transmembrane domain-containing protein n=1 Tax=Strigamia maritima TaxID=126957 RepID=T1J033_STRMM